MVKNVNRTARLQWKVDTIKNCIYLQCGLWAVWESDIHRKSDFCPEQSGINQMYQA